MLRSQFENTEQLIPRCLPPSLAPCSRDLPPEYLPPYPTFFSFCLSVFFTLTRLLSPALPWPRQ